MNSLVRRFAPLLVLPILAACGSGATNSSTTSEAISASASKSFAWSEDALFSTMISTSEFESWGFPDGPGSESGTGEIAVDSLGLLHSETALTTPSECIALYSFYSELKNYLPGSYYLFQEHYDATLANGIKLLVVGLDSESEAKTTFEKIKSLSSTCKKFDAKRGSELKSIVLWDSLTIDEPNYIQGESGGIPVAFGIEGSAIWYEESITPVGEEGKAREALSKSRALLSAKLSAAQSK